jgi:hypothetical protein
MSFSYGLHVENDYDLPATLAAPQLDRVYQQVGAVYASRAAAYLDR